MTWLVSFTFKVLYIGSASSIKPLSFSLAENKILRTRGGKDSKGN